jgi:hypothetical protein
MGATVFHRCHATLWTSRMPMPFRALPLTLLLMPALLGATPPAAAQASPNAPEAASPSADAVPELNGYAVNPPVMRPACVRNFRRMKVARVEVDLVLELDDAGAVNTAIFGTASVDDDFNGCILEWVRTLRFKPESPRRGVFVSSIINASLTPPPPKYVQYAGDDAATVQNWGSAFTLCKLTGMPGNDRNYACLAYALLIDGHVGKWSGKSNRIAPGPRLLSLACSIQAFHAGAWPIPTMQYQTHVFTLEAGGDYKLEPRWEGPTCVVDVIDTKRRQRLDKIPFTPGEASKLPQPATDAKTPPAQGD